MTAINFKPSLGYTLAHEGGFVNNPRDPGGATNFGVTQAVYDAYRKRGGSKLQSVKLIASIEVSDIYNKNYWKLARGDTLPTGLDYAVFDFSVNSGVSRALRYLQRLVGVNDDGILGDISLAAIDKQYAEDEEKLIAQYCANRLAFLKSLGTFDEFGKGWTRRVVGAHSGVQLNDNGVIDYAVIMARNEAPMPLPLAIGSLPGEVPAKAFAPLEPETFVEAPAVSTVADLRALAAENDALASKILGS